MFIELKREGGQTSVVNTDAIAFVNARGHNQPPRVMLTNGVDFQVDEEYADVVAKLMPSATPMQPVGDGDGDDDDR